MSQETHTRPPPLLLVALVIFGTVADVLGLQKILQRLLQQGLVDDLVVAAAPHAAELDPAVQSAIVVVGGIGRQVEAAARVRVRGRDGLGVNHGQRRSRDEKQQESGHGDWRHIEAENGVSQRGVVLYPQERQCK